MDESSRLQELKEYRILDTLPEKELNDLAQIASAICDTPISLITFVDEERQWFKAKKGLDAIETPRVDSFCQHALGNPREVLVVEDPLHDERFRNNSLVFGNPHIRFYAGAPLETPAGHVLGTLCILDNKPRQISESQKNALMLLARRAMEYLETRKLLLAQEEEITLSAARLKKLTDQAPVVIYQLNISPEGKMVAPFISKGIADIYPNIDQVELMSNPAIVFDAIHPDDVELVRKSLQDSFVNLVSSNVEYRVLSEDGSTSWYWAHANPEKKDDGSVTLYGTLQNITEKKEYIETLEQILFDISHVMRKPVSNMLGLTAAIEQCGNIDEDTLKKFAGHIKTVSKEMDTYINKLNDAYHERRSKVKKSK